MDDDVHVRSTIPPILHLGRELLFRKLQNMVPASSRPRSIRSIHRTIYHKQFDIVEVLLQYGADVNLKDDDGWTALYAAAAGGNLGVSTLLLQHSQIDIEASDNNGFTALHRAVEEGHSIMVEFLASWNANINTTDDKGITPLETARASEKVSTEDVLLTLISSRH